MSIRSILSLTVLAASTTCAVAGGFVDVVNTGARTAGSTNNIATDAFYLAAVPTSWVKLDQRITSVTFAVSAGFAAGSFTDTVWRDPATQALIFGSYFALSDTTHGVTEINSMVRSGFGGISTVSAAWTFADTVYSGAAAGYRLRDPARSDYVASYVAATATTGAYYDPAKIAMRTDVNPAEGNPNSGLYLLKVDGSAYTYTTGTNAMRLVQGASATEGGRIFQDTTIDAFVVTAVPEAQTYAMMLAGLGVLGFVARRRKKVG